MQPQPPVELILQHEVRRADVAEALLDLQEQVPADLLADGELRGRAALGRNLNVERIEMERVAD